MLPKLFWERAKGKRHPKLLQRLGFDLPLISSSHVIWIHAVSVGEIKAAASLFLEAKKHFPQSFFCITTTTSTGFSEAKRSIPLADAIVYAPMDFSFVVKRFIQKIKPSLYLLVESDIWPNLLKSLHQNGVKIFLVSGKLSPRAFSRWSLIPKMAKQVFSCFDLICAQTKEDASRFLSFSSNAITTGNLKFDMIMAHVAPFPTSFLSPCITISCTHAKEEELIFKHLPTSIGTIFLAPRHPERFEEVAAFLKNKGISFIRWKEIAFWKGESVILVDAMGMLPACYAASKAAIIGGSFVPIGGHNALEPCLYGCPVVFGPHMFCQKIIAHTVIEAKAGIQTSLQDLPHVLEKVFANHGGFSQKALALVEEMRGVSIETMRYILEKVRTKIDDMISF